MTVFFSCCSSSLSASSVDHGDCEVDELMPALLSIHEAADLERPDRIAVSESVSESDPAGSGRNLHLYTPIRLASSSVSQSKSKFKRVINGFLREQDSGPMICTDRNSVTPHPNVVPLGYLQFEGGATLEKFNRGGDYFLPETFARLGAWKNGELRFQAPNYFSSTDTRGVTDIQVGIKQELEPALLNKRGMDLGVIAGMSLPTGSRYLTTGAVDPFVQMIGFYKFHKSYTLGTSHSIFMPTLTDDDPVFGVSTNRRVTYQPTVILFRHMRDFRSPERVDVWVEYAGLFPSGQPSIQIIDLGAVWRPYQRHQVDFRMGFGITDSAPRALMGFGYSWLVGRALPFYKKHPGHIYRP